MIELWQSENLRGNDTMKNVEIRKAKKLKLNKQKSSQTSERIKIRAAKFCRELVVVGYIFSFLSYAHV